MPLYEAFNYGGVEKTAVVFDFGYAYTKCGFAGEVSPRWIGPTVLQQDQTTVRVLDNNDLLYKNQSDFIQRMYFRHLLVNPKERRVVVVESVLCVTHIRQCIAKVFFEHLEVPSVLFAPAHQVSLFSLGVPSALVIDCGYRETLVLPVFEGTPVLKAWEALPLAGKAIHDHLNAKLFEHAVVKTPDKSEKSLSSITANLSEATLEDIKIRCCFVTRFERGTKIQAFHADQDVEIPTPPPAIDYPLEGGNLLQIDGAIREHTCEVLFEQDAEQTSVATLVLDSILKCDIDIRKTMADNLIIMGGTSMQKGFEHRLLAELNALLAEPRYSQKLALSEFRLHRPPSKPNYTAWLGGAVFASLEVLGSRSLSRDSYLANKKLPDWSDVSTNSEPVEKSPVHPLRK